MQIVACLDDAAVSSDGISVYSVAYQVIWVCLVEDSALFLRYVLERLTRDRQDQMFKLLRHLIRFVPRLPQQAAFALYNYIIGYIMFYVRSSHDQSQQVRFHQIRVCARRWRFINNFCVSSTVGRRCFVRAVDDRPQCPRNYVQRFKANLAEGAVRRFHLVDSKCSVSQKDCRSRAGRYLRKTISNKFPIEI